MNYKSHIIKSTKELLVFLVTRIAKKKKWWLLPLIILLWFMSLFINIFSSGKILPIIYTLF